MPFFSTVYIKTYAMLNDCLQGYYLKHAFRCSFVCIYSSMLKKAEESSIQYSRRVDASICVRALQMCARETSQTACDCPEHLLCWPCEFGQSLYRVLTREIEQECRRWW